MWGKSPQNKGVKAMPKGQSLLRGGFLWCKRVSKTVKLKRAKKKRDKKMKKTNSRKNKNMKRLKDKKGHGSRVKGRDGKGLFLGKASTAG